MNLFVALCTIATVSLVRASSLEEYDHDVEDQDLELDLELSPRDMEEYDGDDLDVELREGEDSEGRRRPPKHPFCIRTFRSGWGGQCLTPAALKYHSCDFIWDDINPVIRQQPICRNESLYCCVDCHAQKQTDNCRIKGATSWRKCCPGDRVFKTMNSGCSCCGECKRKSSCRKREGFCVTRNDPVCSFDYCKDNGGKLKYKRCEGEHCKCCIGAPNPGC